MKERQILFSAPMVRAILEGRKTQTRRVAKLADFGDAGKPWMYRNCRGNFVWGMRASDTLLDMQNVHCPYGQPGDRLWVRETWAPLEAAGTPYIYRADADEDGSVPYLIHGSPMGGGVGHANPHRWKPSIHMPRRASRILLEVVSVRVERLLSIKAIDVIAEGVEFEQRYPMENGCLAPCDEARAFNAFWELWCSINGRESWDANPWVWVVEFRRVTP